jgi:hypothetical protein
LGIPKLRPEHTELYALLLALRHLCYSKYILVLVQMIAAYHRGYQTLINAALREAMQKKTIEMVLRKVIREELHSQ